MSDIVLDVDNLHTHFFTRRGLVRAVDGVRPSACAEAKCLA